MDQLWPPLFHLERKGILERSIHGAVVAAHGSEIILQTFDPILFGRSLTKPFQMKAVAKILADVLPWEEKAIGVSSHSGTASQQAAVRKILSAKDLSLIQLPSLAHPCSGKHAAILKACELQGWPLQSYKELSHPYNVIYRELLEKNLGRELATVTVAKDGCGLPTWAMRISDLAKLFANLVVQKNDDWIWEAAQRFPEMIGGPGRVDTLIIQSSEHLFAKEGADGLLGISVEDSRFPNGLGLIVKIAHGYDPIAAWHVAHFFLQKMQIRLPEPSPYEGQELIWN